ncbi:MAG: formylglycine-generating enzyme family protein, partial [Planctomycetota bacterium]|nr:formylglycine-generating enzyme family protein [Planctomycetota bacterium]
TLFDLYRDDPDPGLHGAVEWLLRQWHQGNRLKALDEQLAQDRAQAKRGWYINGQGQTMVVVHGPVEFMMGSPANDADRRSDERLHKRQIYRGFAIATTEVTVEQWDRFLRAKPDLRSVFTANTEYKERHYPDAAGPQCEITWYEATLYCNWLSAQAGLPEDEWQYGRADNEGRTRVLPGYENKVHTGYRLPIEAEWEYACRAGAVTSRYFGATERLLDRYAYYDLNSQKRAWPAAGLKPNDLGLFGMLGNALEWCEDYNKSAHGQHVRNFVYDDSCMLRGGSFINRARFERVDWRTSDLAQYRSYLVGFRVARTLR